MRIKKFFTMREMKPWPRLLRQVVNASSLETLKVIQIKWNLVIWVGKKYGEERNLYTALWNLYFLKNIIRVKYKPGLDRIQHHYFNRFFFPQLQEKNSHPFPSQWCLLYKVLTKQGEFIMHTYSSIYPWFPAIAII